MVMVINGDWLVSFGFKQCYNKGYVQWYVIEEMHNYFSVLALTFSKLDYYNWFKMESTLRKKTRMIFMGDDQLD